ncbi:MAG: thiamine/thiamine pyrophosphate ABC transporter permease ThiP [Rhodobacteraceae bacterium]|nr:MAG: thiamine/thiamine pyrophosphate ABC transporter permease ThiP [Paracoccaceae bacterium]
MARRDEPVTEALPRRVALTGGAALVLLLALTLGSVAVVALRAERAGALGPADWRALSFTLRQAFWSAALSTAFAIPLARALARRRFPGRAALTTLLGAPFLLPSIIAILGVIAVWGRSGWVSEALMAAGLARLNVYGMPGVLIAHVFFNLPLATRLMLQAYAAVPPERWRIAAQLGVEGRALFRLLEWPAIRAAAPGAFALVFSICATSFAIALALGGGPRATTLEVAIYEAAAVSFDLDRAARLAAVQFAVCAAAALAALALAAPPAAGFGVRLCVERWDGRGRAARAADALALALAILFLALPLAGVAARGVAGLGALTGAAGAAVWAAAGRSLAVALGSTLLTALLALPLAALVAALDRRPFAARLAEAGALTPLAASPFVIGVALFVVLRPVADPAALALPLTALVNAAMATPFAVRILAPAIRDAEADHGRLADSLGLSGWTRTRAVHVGRLRAPLGFALGLAAALSAGDLGVIALFSRPDAPTLPLLMHLLAGSRNVDAAFGAAFVLTGLAFALFLGFDRLGRGR